MTRIAERTVLFADLRGSTSLFERLGNAEATSVITHTVGELAKSVVACGGLVVKTLGDGLMAVFEASVPAAQAAGLMQDTLERLVTRGSEHGASAGLRALRLQVALARGELSRWAVIASVTRSTSRPACSTTRATTRPLRPLRCWRA